MVLVKFKSKCACSGLGSIVPEQHFRAQKIGLAIAISASHYRTGVCGLTAVPSHASAVGMREGDLEKQFAAFVSADPQPQIILGTQSESRRAVVDELAAKFNFKYSSITADIDEQAIRRQDPQDLVLVLAHAKADAIVKKLKASSSLVTPGYLVTCDQVRVFAKQNSRNSPHCQHACAH